jgi:glutaryl-CoA dehydrogenase
MADFAGIDFLLLDEDYSDEELISRDTVRSWVTDRFLPVIQEHIRQDGSFPMELVPEIAELGLFGANLHGYGCAGMNNVAYGLVMQELERGDSGLRSFASVQGSLCMYPIHAYGSEEQKQEWLPKMAAGEAIGCFGLTEPDFGSYAQGMRTKAERKNGGWVLNGTKRWITNGSLAHVAIVWAQTEDGVRGFLVPKGTPGYEAPDIKGKFSLRGSVTSELYFKDVELPETAMLPDAKGMKGPLSCLTQARYGIAWGALGAAMACFDEVVEYSKQRIVQGGPLATKQLTQARLADMFTEITKGQLLALRVAQLKDAGKLHHTMVSMIKRNNVDIALTVARNSRDLLGANGIVDDYQAMRHMVNLETVRTYEGTHDIHTLILGEHVTGMRAL